jgi:hypothetical protein
MHDFWSAAFAAAFFKMKRKRRETPHSKSVVGDFV